jgi:carbon monoxide dehydrogenase subunit G
VADIDRSRTIAADPKEVWDVLADFGSISSWVLAYDVEGLPKRLRRFNHRWSLQPAHDGNTVVTLTSTVEIGSGPLRKLAERVVCRVQVRQSDVMLAGLANRLEKPRV